MTFAWAFVAALGAYRLAHLVTQERGPFDVFDRWRNLFLKDDWLGHGVRCLYCVSFWFAGVLAGLLAGTLKEFFLLWFGIAGAVLILDRYWRR